MTTIPATFWQQIGHQLDRIATEAPDTFDKVRAILLDPAYDQIVKDVNRNFRITFGPDAAFFAGSGGDRTLFHALYRAGWSVITMEASYYYVMRHETTGEALTYIEGDVVRGDQIGGE